MFVIFQDRIATRKVAEELLPEGRSLAIPRALEPSQKETRSDALAKDSHSVAMLVASTTETNSNETQPLVPRICYDSRKPLPFWLKATTQAYPKASQILPAQKSDEPLRPNRKRPNITGHRTKSFHIPWKNNRKTMPPAAVAAIVQEEAIATETAEVIAPAEETKIITTAIEVAIAQEGPRLRSRQLGRNSCS